jgi:hypothetical protein
MLRPGNAGANTAADHIDCFEAALWQLEGLVPEEVGLVVRADTRRVQLRVLGLAGPGRGGL